ncbi:MAG: oxygen-independent coproporphyrinogen III oxidase [Spirochaetales bacterium]|nr:oxygen-independent coproporphyrinogen III oxidase [Spirochaetales bacterium]
MNDELLHLDNLSKKYDETNIPLYLSYPTTSFWKTAAGADAFVQAYKPGETPFLYFHFPFCKKACTYCCCYKRVTQDENDKERYIDYLAREIELKKRALGADRLNNVRQMHWGGGTPAYMTCGQIERAFSVISEFAETDRNNEAGISIEAYPDESVLTVAKLELLRELGFNELSLGIQDFDERIQKTINRDCKEDAVGKIVDQARGLGFRIHIDLCYGLPFQGLNELEKTVRLIAAMAPDRVAAFPYAHYPLVFPLQRSIPASSLPNSFMKILLIRHATALFDGAGYKKIGIDHFVRKDNSLYTAFREKKVIKDFMGYSVDGRKTFIGFGHSAISRMGRWYFHNCTGLEDYYRQLDKGELPFEAKMAHSLSQDDLIRDRVILKSILCDFTIDKRHIGSQFGIDFDGYFRGELKILEKYREDGVVDSVSGDIINVTPAGRYLARHLACVFDGYYNRKRQ